MNNNVRNSVIGLAISVIVLAIVMIIRNLSGSSDSVFLMIGVAASVAVFYFLIKVLILFFYKKP